MILISGCSIDKDMKTVKTLKVRVKDKHSKQLSRMARSVNFVWNYVNELSHRSIKERSVFLSEFDLHPYTKGAGRELGVHSQTLQMVAKEYTTRRKQFNKSKLKWRKSEGSRRSLGWIPVSGQSLKRKNGKVVHNGVHFSVWDSYGLGNYKFKSGSFNEDSRGRWYFNVVVEVEVEQSEGTGSVGIDLGLKETATTSDGEVLKGREYRKLESQLGLAQRANKKKRVKSIHAKIKNRRKDAIHKFTSSLVKDNAAIFVGNVNSQSLVKTKMAKSVLDSGWGMLKTILEYKCANAGVVFEVVNESYTTQTCSSCGKTPDSSPKG